ncbi:hypothetical protein C882_1607 [Caenispirillum salinarum AK4]|uniref:Uncharacterized protein n=1 Tax=Caenispirillum salinarum AK4 TaxID=1238182 RepID=K9H6T7_9PROT|nr:hypothetical protein C882_1607 [Caenispirillum salinarum AK4]
MVWPAPSIGGALRRRAVQGRYTTGLTPRARGIGCGRRGSPNTPALKQGERLRRRGPPATMATGRPRPLFPIRNRHERSWPTSCS